MHDFAIRNALLLDGRGSAPVHGDLAVQDGRIAAIGRDVGAARETIDADGFEMLERQGTVMNVAGFVGHSSVRTYVMGDDAARRAATDSEIASMRKIVLDGMRAGAIGFATSTSAAHNGEGGIPMPSRLADEKEMRTLVGCLKDAGRGIFMLTKGSQTTMSFLEELAADSGRPVLVAALLHDNTNPRVVFDALEAISAARTRGRRMAGAMSCCPLTMDFTLHSPYLLEGLAAWKPAMALSGDAYRAKLAEPAFRAAVRAEVESPATFRVFNGEWDKMQVVETTHPEHARYEQQTLAALAAQAGTHPLSFMLDLALAENLDTVFTALLLNSDEKAVGQMLRHPSSLVSLSDAGAHLTFFNDAGFGLHLLGHWVREREALTLAEGVRKLTGDVAGLFGIQERGLLASGYRADLMLFDPARVNRGPKARVRDLPANGARLTTPAIGVHGVWVNGVRIADANGLRLPDKMPGKFLRQFAA